MTRIQRLVANLFGSWFQLRRHFPAALLDDMAHAIAAGEQHHLGEVCFALESRMSAADVLAGLSARRRAEQAFAQLRVWDTKHNSGVLFYVLLAEHRLEIIADRGIAAKVAAAEWDAICANMQDSYARGQWRDGSLAGIAAAHAVLLQHFPSDGVANPDELPDRPILL